MAQVIWTADGPVEFPDTMTDAQIKAVLRRQYAKVTDAYSTDPTEGMTTTQKFLAGAGKGMTDLARGAGQLLGLVDEAEIAEADARDAPLMATGAGQAGQIAGGVASALPAMLVPGANSLIGASAIGALEGALNPTTDDESRLQNMALGAAAGPVGQLGGNALARVLNPQTRDAAKALIDQGITPTPGQILGGASERLEAGIEGIPFLGEGIRTAKRRAIREFNQTALNRALEPIGQQVDEVGHEGIKKTRDLIETAYDDALALVPRVDFDQTFTTNLANIRSMANTFTPARKRQFNAIIDTELMGKLTPARTLSGPSYKEVESTLKRLGREFRSSTSFDERQIGDALNAVVAEMRDVAARSSPDAAQALKKADSAYARLLRLERAAGMQGAPDGVFTPSQLGNAIRAMDSSVRKKNISQGTGLMQDLTTQAREVLGDKIPNSGTPERLGAMALATMAGQLNPAIPVAMVAGRLAYTKPGQKIASSMLTARPDMVREVGDFMSDAAPLSGLLGVQLLVNDD